MWFNNLLCRMGVHKFEKQLRSSYHFYFCTRSDWCRGRYYTPEEVER